METAEITGSSRKVVFSSRWRRRRGVLALLLFGSASLFHLAAVQLVPTLPLLPRQAPSARDLQQAPQDVPQPSPLWFPGRHLSTLRSRLEETRHGRVEALQALGGSGGDSRGPFLHEPTEPPVPQCECNALPAGKGLGEEESNGEEIPFGSPEFFVYAGISFALVCTAGLMAGLTMGLLSVDPIELEIYMNDGGLPAQKLQAQRIWPVVSQHHRLLVTLLLMNAVANEALPIFLDRLVPPFAAILMSVSLVLVFGEILPSAIFTGSRQMALGAALTPVVQLLMLVTAPISWPLSKLLDCLLGEEGIETRFNRRQLRTLVNLHHTQANRKSHGEGEAAPFVSNHHTHHSNRLSHDEVTIISGALDMMSKTVRDSMTPISEVKMLDESRALDDHTMADLVYFGHSRVPVYRGGDRNNIVGLLIMKRLIVLDPSDARPITSLPLRKPLVVRPGLSLFEMLNQFQAGRSHLALVTDQPESLRRCWQTGQDLSASGVVIEGLITIEDVIEELIQEEIEDEEDVRDDLIVDPLTSHSSLASLSRAGSATGEGNCQITRNITLAESKGVLVMTAVGKFRGCLARARSRKQKSLARLDSGAFSPRAFPPASELDDQPLLS